MFPPYRVVWTMATRRHVGKTDTALRFGHVEKRALQKCIGACRCAVFPEEARLKKMVALVVLVLILALLGGLGFAVHVLWYVLIFAILLWLIGFFIGGVEGGGRRRWYGRW
jgi:hypothetical protein